jgi:hypothetical protein
MPMFHLIEIGFENGEKKIISLSDLVCLAHEGKPFVNNPKIKYISIRGHSS